MSMAGIAKGALGVLIPGGGRILRRRYLSAAAELVVWAAFIEAYVLVRTVSPSGLPRYAEAVLLTGVLGIFAVNAIVEGLRLVRDAGNASGGQLDEIYREALAAFVAGDDKKADELLRTALRFDALNVDCLYLRAEVAARLGAMARARRLFRKCRDFDETGKWNWETKAALERL
jgi:tetratricopeptide (TPR) repeat protein